MEEVMEILQSLRTVIDEVMTRVEAVEKRQSDLENMMIKEFFDPLQKRVDEVEGEMELDAFKEKVGDKFDPYLEYSKQVNGEDYDLYKDTLDGFKAIEPAEGEEMPTEEEYIEATVEVLKNTMEKLRATLNGEDIEVSADGENIELKVDGETVAEEKVEDSEEKSEEEPAEETTEEPVEEEKAEEEVSEDTEEDEDEMDSEEEIQADLEALEKEMEMYR